MEKVHFYDVFVYDVLDEKFVTAFSTDDLYSAKQIYDVLDALRLDVEFGERDILID